MRRMTKRFGVMALVFLASAFSFATVTVSGNLVNPATGSVSSRAFVRFWIRGCGGNAPRVTGTGIVLPSFTDFTPTAGAISGTVYDSLTEISCGGSVGATWYGVQAYYDGKPGPEVPYNVTGASFNLNNATPNTTSPVVAAPTGDSTYARLDGGNDPFTGSIIAPGFQPTGDPTYNVKAYGALGDGSHDDTSAIQAAITAAAAQGTVFIPVGTYKITSQLNVAGTGRFIVQCAGDGAIIQFDGATVPIALGSPDTTQRNLITIRDCHFISSTTGSGLAIDASHWTQSSLEHLNIFGVNKCILMNNVHALYNEIHKLRCSVTGVGAYGMKFDSVANENSVFKARIITDANATGVIVNTQGVKLYDVDVETGALIGIDVQASARTTLISGAWLEGNQTNLQLASGAQGTTVIASEINSGSVADITDNGATNTIMCGVRKTFVMQPCTLGSGLITSNSNPASAGTVRLAKADTIKFRNNANGADVSALSLDASDRIVLPSLAATSSAVSFTAPTFISSTANPATAGAIRIASSDSINARNNANSSNITLVGLNVSDQVVIGGALGDTVIGTKVATVGTQNATGNFGVSPTVAVVHSTAQTASIGTTTLLTTNAGTGQGPYRICYYATTTTSGTGTTATVTVGWTDLGAAKTFTTGTFALNSTGNTGFVSGCQSIYATANTNITYAVTVGSIGSSAYAVDVWLKRDN